MALTDAEFATILADDSKRVQGDVAWKEDEDRSPAVEFRIDIESTNGWPLFVKGRYNVAAGTLTYALILKTAGRIYGLDLGKDHHNPECNQIGEKHKHRWSERYGDKVAYVPDDVNAPVSDLVTVWKEFCVERRIQHDGSMKPPPPTQGGIVVMDASDLCQDLQRRIGALFTCSEHGDYQRIRTPYLYPDGDNIDLFCRVDGETVTVSDLAETTGWLRMQSAALRRSPKQTRLIEDACLTHGIEFYRGMLQAQCRSGDELAQVVTRVAQAALRVSDLWFTFRTQAVESITDEVADFLNERELAFDRAAKLVGRSGRGWTVDFHVRTEKRSSLVQVLSTGNRAAAHRVSEHVLAAWHDLNHLVAGPEALTFVSLFDDTADVWADEDFRLVEPLSTLSRWSRPDEFAAVLSEAA